ncbi:MAG: squalene/phytoene synthase family protein [Phycisphaerae bacterium]|nr:squalene/phytoene synthase family protein [Phycisphaerae bacterium]
MDSFIARHLQGVSRTYAILIPMLPGKLADAIGLAYLLMRIVDTLEDYPPLSDDERLRLIGLLEHTLSDPTSEVHADLCAAIGDNDDEVELMRHTAEVIARLRDLEPVYRDAAAACALEMMKGVREFIARAAERGQPYPAVRSAAEMRSYCYYVAGVVGVMLCEMMAHWLKRPQLTSLRDLAIELGIGLQLVNIVKDALKDSKHGRRYLPTSADGKLSPGEIYKAALEEARTSLQRGVEFVLALPAQARELRYFCGLPIAWGAMTLSHAERDSSRAKIGRSAIASSIDHFKALAGDDTALRRWLSGMLGEQPSGVQPA